MKIKGWEKDDIFFLSFRSPSENNEWMREAAYFYAREDSPGVWRQRRSKRYKEWIWGRNGREKTELSALLCK